MSELLRENAHWRKGKSPIIAKYSEDHRKLMSAIAGRGFIVLPGYAYDAENRLELETKMSLSDLNYKILSETIERELKQLGIDYNSAYKNALMLWEMDKQTLLSDWDAEFADIKKGMESEEETLARLAIEVSKRAITLTTQKTAIELQIEGYRKTLAELDGTVSPYEVELANAKLVTAQKKVDIIPILEEILVKEQSLLVVEQEKAAAYTLLIAAENAVSTKKGDLVVPMGELVNKIEEHTSKIAEQVITEGEIANEKLNQLTAAQTKAGYQVDELTSEIEAEGKRVTLAEKKRTLDGKIFDDEQDLNAHDLSRDETYQADVASKFDALMTKDADVHSAVMDNKETIYETRSKIRTDSSTRLTNAGISSDSSIVNEEIRGNNEIAEIQAAAKITAQLTHLIGD